MKTPNATEIRFRTFVDADLPEVRRLWRDDAQWGDVTPELWRQWYVDTPNGPALIVVGEDPGGRIVAQAAMTPYRLLADGREHRAAHLAAPIISRQMQSTWLPTIHHPSLGLLIKCNEVATDHGMKALFGMPRASWLTLLKLAPMLGFEAFPGNHLRCFDAPLDDAPDPPADIDTTEVSRFDDEYAGLWEQAVNNLPIRCGIIRDPAYLNYRNLGHLCLAMRSKTSGRLIGYTATRHDGQVMDMLPADRSVITDLILATWHYLGRVAAPEKTAQMNRIRLMETPDTQETVSRLGFRKIRFRFGFTCRPLDPTLAKSLAPSRWYLTPNG